MKKFLATLILILMFHTPSQADDIRDFQIEGMSIGDSLLDYYSKYQIENDFRKIKYKGSDKFYLLEYEDTKLENYDEVSFHFKKNDKDFIIQAIGGGKLFENDEKNCKIFKKKIILDIQNIIKNLESENYRFYYKLLHDGKSYADVTDFFLKDGSTIRAWCVNWSKVTERKSKKNKDKMIIALSLKEFDKWLKNEAHK